LDSYPSAATQAAVRPCHR